MYLTYRFPQEICCYQDRHFTWINHKDKWQIGQTYEIPPLYKSVPQYLLGYSEISQEQVEDFLLTKL